MKALLPYVEVEKDREKGTTLVYLFLANIQLFHKLMAQPALSFWFSNF